MDLLILSTSLDTPKKWLNYVPLSPWVTLDHFTRRSLSSLSKTVNTMKSDRRNMSNIFKSVKGQVLCSWDIEEVKSWKPEQNFEGECGFEEWSYRKIKSEKFNPKIQECNKDAEICQPDFFFVQSEPIWASTNDQDQHRANRTFILTFLLRTIFNCV